MGNAVQIVGDVGGTNARFAYVHKGSDELLGIEYFRSDEFPLFVDVIRAYIKAVNLVSVDRICLAVAAPITDDLVDFPNNHWLFRRTELASTLGVPLRLMNDFDAQALALNALQDSELHWLGSPRPVGQRTKAVLGPGTGLGVSAILPGGGIVPSEGGHIAFAPLNAHEDQLNRTLRSRYDRVSIERILSGQGLVDLHWANGRSSTGVQLGASGITAAAIDGNPACVATINDFLSILASVSGDLALMMGATDGVYVAGGIVPRLLALLDEKQFRQRFEDKGRYSSLCADIPLAIVLAEHAGLRGCVAALQKPVS